MTPSLTPKGKLLRNHLFMGGLLFLLALIFSIQAFRTLAYSHADSVSLENTNLSILFVKNNTVKILNTAYGTWNYTISPIPYGDGERPPSENARAIVADSTENLIHIFNGTFDPYLSIYDQTAQTWANYTSANWDLVNNGRYGGIGMYENFIFMTDMNLTNPSGVLKFDTETEQFTRFGNTLSPIDLTIGSDNLLYVFSSPNQVDVFDPTTEAFIKTIILDSSDSFDDIAVNAQGEIFATEFSSIRHFDNDGELIYSMSTPNYAFWGDIALHPSGVIALGTWGNGIIALTDETLQTLQIFDVSDSSSNETVNLTFITQPTISSMMLPIVQHIPTPTPTTPPPTPIPTPITSIHPGYWDSNDAPIYFYVTSDGGYVDEFSVITYASCGTIRIYITELLPITNSQFTFDGQFYGNGTFNSDTTAYGQFGVDNIYVAQCGIYVNFDLQDWTAYALNLNEEPFSLFGFPLHEEKQPTGDTVDFEVEVLK